MNAKKCKALRRIAREASVGMPARRLTIGKQVAYTQAGKSFWVEVVTNSMTSTRGIYRALKREAR